METPRTVPGHEQMRLGTEVCSSAAGFCVLKYLAGNYNKHGIRTLYYMTAVGYRFSFLFSLLKAPDSWKWCLDSVEI